MYETGILYELSPFTQVNQPKTMGIRLIGDSVNITDILGSEQEPTSLTDMSSIAPEDIPFIESGWLSFAMLPRFISFVGTVDSMELSRGSLISKGLIT